MFPDLTSTAQLSGKENLPELVQVSLAGDTLGSPAPPGAPSGLSTVEAGEGGLPGALAVVRKNEPPIVKSSG